MDDLDHSVLIAEQDWDCFCTESEECSVQQAKLAALDESGFSDSDDDKNSIHASSLPSPTSPDQLPEKNSIEECRHQSEESAVNNASEKSESNKFSNAETEAHNAEQTFSVRVNEQEATYEGQENNLAEKLRGNCENQENGGDKSRQATISTVSEMSSADIKKENSTDGIESLTEVTDSSLVAKKEKERWFVTVNNSPVRVKSLTSVQKKRRKKKRSKNLSQENSVMEKCSFNNNTEPDKEIMDSKTMQYKIEQENISSDLSNIQNMIHIQDVKCISSTGSSEDEEDNTSGSITVKQESMTEIPEAKLERNPGHSLNSLLTPKQVPQMIFKDLSSSLPEYWDHESTACDKSIVNISSECAHKTDNLDQFKNDKKSEMSASKHTATLSNTEGEQTEVQEPLGQSNKREESSQSSQETQSSSFHTSGPSPAIFAISSFWDEMEKLTINDILQLRIANNRSLVRENIILEESSSVDTLNAHLLESGEVESKDESLEDGLVDDAADSDYFTHLDDSKPDRSSCEFSTFSDFDDEFIQLLHVSANPSPEPLESRDETQSFLESTCGVDSEKTWQSESNEIVKLFPETDPLLYMYSAKETEMQDIFLTSKDDNNMSNFLLDHCSMTRSTPSPILSVSDILEDQCLLSFFEILKSDTELEGYQAWSPDRNTSLCFSQSECLAETYDDFFSDFEVANFLFPSVRGSTKSEKNLLPIYSSSRSVVKDLEFPEVEEVIQSDIEDESSAIQHMSASSSKPSNVCFITSHRSTWRNLSLRHTKLFMGRSWYGMPTSCVFPKTANNVCDYRIRTASTSSIAPPDLPVLLQENQAFGKMTEHQINVGATVADADKDHFLFSLKQADMCLVCIAFASWVLKSSNPQTTDMWKAALLANVSAISAIQYLRKYIKEG